MTDPGSSARSSRATAGLADAEGPVDEHEHARSRQCTVILSHAAMTPTPKMPDWLEPMAATLTQERFSGGNWLFERKFDGIRLLAYKRGTDVQLYSRNRLPQNLPPLAAAIARPAR